MGSLGSAGWQPPLCTKNEGLQPVSSCSHGSTAKEAPAPAEHGDGRCACKHPGVNCRPRLPNGMWIWMGPSQSGGFFYLLCESLTQGKTLMEKSLPTSCTRQLGIATFQTKSPIRARVILGMCTGDRGVPVPGIAVTEWMLLGFGDRKDLTGWLLEV